MVLPCYSPGRTQENQYDLPKTGSGLLWTMLKDHAVISKGGMEHDFRIQAILDLSD
jgi:hypothetical protein